MNKKIKLYHVSNPKNRDSILKNGLQPKIGPSYKSHYEEKIMGPVVFVSISNRYDSTYDDDRYLIELSEKEFEKLNFEIDHEVEDALFTTKPINPEFLKIIHYGSGESTF